MPDNLVFGLGTTPRLWYRRAACVRGVAVIYIVSSWLTGTRGIFMGEYTWVPLFTFEDEEKALTCQQVGEYDTGMQVRVERAE